MYKFNLENTIESRIVLSIHRGEHWVYRSENVLFKKVLSLLFSILNHLILQWVFCCVIPKEVEIGKNCSMPHPFGIIMTPKTKIGSDVKIMQFVTIGQNELSDKPYFGIEIGNGVYISAHAQIIGNNLRIGNHAVIGAGAVLISDVPDGQVFVGVPARRMK